MTFQAQVANLEDRRFGVHSHTRFRFRFRTHLQTHVLALGPVHSRPRPRFLVLVLVLDQKGEVDLRILDSAVLVHDSASAHESDLV